MTAVVETPAAGAAGTAVPLLAVPQSFLTRALAWVESAADRSKNPSKCSGIHLRWGKGAANHPPFYGADWAKQPVKGPALTLAATDRYRLMVATIHLDAQHAELEPGSVTVHRPDLLAAAKAWPKTPADTAVTLRVEGEQLHLATPITGHTVTAMHDSIAYPSKIAEMLPDVPAAEPAATVQFNASFVRDITDAARKINPDAVLAMALGQHGRAVTFQTRSIGDDQVVFRGLLMPLKSAS